MTQTLSQWLNGPRPAEQTVAWLEDRTWTLGHLRSDVAYLLQQLQQQDGERWALCFENSYLFVVALLATLHAGKTPVIPGHSRIALLKEQQALFDGVLSDQALDWPGAFFQVNSVSPSIAEPCLFPPVADDAVVVLFTSGSSGQPKQVTKSVTSLDNEAKMLADCFAHRLTGCRVVASVVPQHLYGLTFRIMLPMALGLPFHAAMLYYAEQLAALSPHHRYVFISSPAFLKRLDCLLSPPPVEIVFSAGGLLPWTDVTTTASWLNTWPDEIYGSTETGILAHRYRQCEEMTWSPFSGVTFMQREGTVYVQSPLISQPDGLALDDRLHFEDNGQFRLLGRRGRVVKIEEKRVSLNEVEQRLQALEGILDAVALPVSRGGRQGIGVLLVLDKLSYQQWKACGGKSQELKWRYLLRAWLEPVAIPRYWRVIDEIPVNSMNKRVYAQLEELFHETP